MMVIDKKKKKAEISFTESSWPPQINNLQGGTTSETEYLWGSIFYRLVHFFDNQKSLQPFSSSFCT